MNKTLIKMKKLLHNQQGEIDSSFMTIIGLFVAAFLMFYIPMLSIAGQNDEIAQKVADQEVATFLNSVAKTGAIKRSDLEKLQQTLAATGNTFEITIEIQHLDGNNTRKTIATSGNLIGENERYSTFHTVDELLGYIDENSIDGMIKNYPLNKGDYVIVTAKNTNKTFEQSLRTFMYKVTGKGEYKLVSSDSVMVGYGRKLVNKINSKKNMK